MKKEYLILIALIFILSAYLFLHKENKDNYTLPAIKKIDISEITGFILNKKQGPIKFIKKEKTWTLTDKEYPADPSSVESILDTIKTLKLSALVSQKQDLKRYELDDENRIQVKVMKGPSAIFEFTMGKTAPTFNHTFVMISDDNNIYHANGSFRSNFDKTVEDFRDKKVLEFKQAAIKRFTIEKDGLSRTLISKEEKKDKEKSSITWSSEDGTLVDNKVVSTLLSSLSFLECETYLESLSKNEVEKEKQLCKIHLENETGIELILFKTDKEDGISGISSMNRDVFALSAFNGKEIVSNIEKILGIFKEKDNKE